MPGNCPADLSAWIISAGKARRAGGRDKSFLKADGRSILSNQLERLTPFFGSSINVLTNRPDGYAGYPIRIAPVVHYPNPHAERSNLRGLASVLYATQTDWNFVIACDMPWPDMKLLSDQYLWLERQCQARPGDTPGICLQGPKHAYPFHALYHRDLALAAHQFLGGEDLSAPMSVRRWIPHVPEIVALLSGQLNRGMEVFTGCHWDFNFEPENLSQDEREGQKTIRKKYSRNGSPSDLPTCWAHAFPSCFLMPGTGATRPRRFVKHICSGYGSSSMFET